jgi:hypothetical protein
MSARARTRTLLPPFTAMTLPTPTRQELPIVLKALDRLTQGHPTETPQVQQDRLVALTQAACHVEGLEVSAEHVAQTVAQVLSETTAVSSSVDKTAAALPDTHAPVALSSVPHSPTAPLIPRWRRPATLRRLATLRHRHRDPVVVWYRGLFGYPGQSLGMLMPNLATLFGFGLVGAAVGHVLGAYGGPDMARVCTLVMGVITGYGATRGAEYLANEHHRLQPGTLSPGVRQALEQRPAALAYLQGCESSEVPLLQGDVDSIRALAGLG